MRHTMRSQGVIALLILVSLLAMPMALARGGRGGGGRGGGSRGGGGFSRSGGGRAGGGSRNISRSHTPRGGGFNQGSIRHSDFSRPTHANLPSQGMQRPHQNIGAGVQQPVQNRPTAGTLPSRPQQGLSGQIQQPMQNRPGTNDMASRAQQNPNVQDRRQTRQDNQQSRQDNRSSWQDNRNDRQDQRQDYLSNAQDNRQDFIEDQDWDDYYGWHYGYDDYPWGATAAGAVMGSMAGFALGAAVDSVPEDSEQIVVDNQSYYYSDGNYYSPQPTGGYQVVNAPTGASVNALPTNYEVAYHQNVPYYVVNGTFYQHTGNGYAVVDPPAGIVVRSLPNFAEPVVSNGQRDYRAGNLLYQPYYQNGSTVYRVSGQ